MHCPEHIILDSKIVFITLHTSWDYQRLRWVPWRERLNPLRYEFIIAPFTKYRTVINKDGTWARRASNWWWRVKDRMDLL